MPGCALVFDDRTLGISNSREIPLRPPGGWLSRATDAVGRFLHPFLVPPVFSVGEQCSEKSALSEGQKKGPLA